MFVFFYNAERVLQYYVSDSAVTFDTIIMCQIYTILIR